MNFFIYQYWNVPYLTWGIIAILLLFALEYMTKYNYYRRMHYSHTKKYMTGSENYNDNKERMANDAGWAKVLKFLRLVSIYITLIIFIIEITLRAHGVKA